MPTDSGRHYHRQPNSTSHRSSTRSTKSTRTSSTKAYWQHQYKKLTYEGWHKETLDDLAARIIEIVAKAWPDYIRPSDGKQVDREETRTIYTKNKFWELQTPEIQEKLFYELGNSDAPLSEAIVIAKKAQTSKQQAAKEEQCYETILHVEKADSKDEEISALKNMVKAQDKKLNKLLQTKSPEKPQGSTQPQKQVQYAQQNGQQKPKKSEEEPPKRSRRAERK